jgi:beta-glucosidase
LQADGIGHQALRERHQCAADDGHAQDPRPLAGEFAQLMQRHAEDGRKSNVGKLDAAYPAGGCGVTTSYPVFNQADRAAWPLYIAIGAQREPLGADLNRVVALPGVKVETSQVNTQQDGKLVTWSGAASRAAHGARAAALPAFATTDGALQFDTIVTAAPGAGVTLAVASGAVDATALFGSLAGKGK